MLIEHARVLLVDDDADLRESTRKLLALSGLPCLAVDSAQKALELLPRDWEGVLLSDVRMPGMDGEQLLHLLKQREPQLPVILFTGHGDIPMAVRAVRAGAFEFLEKPVAPTELVDCIHRALAQRQDFLQARRLRAGDLDRMFPGEHPLASQLRERLLMLAETDLPVYLYGESGTGRRSLAEHLHQHGRQQDGQLVSIGPGHPGLQQATLLQQACEQAGGGSLLLLSPEQFPPDTQLWLANWLLEQGKLRRCRVISISREAASATVADGSLQADLYYAIATACLETPSLRQRREDIPLLFRLLVKQSCQRLQKPLPDFDETFVASLQYAPWPGNLRELRNVADMYAIGLARIAPLERTVVVNAEQASLDERLDKAEKALIEEALSLNGGRVTETAAYLHIPRKKLYLRMKKHGLAKEEFKP